MTIDVLPGKSRSKSTASEPLPIGEADANIFDCPACRRPLGVGSRRCPGCGTRLLSGARATTVLSFGVGGLLIGLLVGGGVAFGALTLSATTAAVVETPASSAGPIATAGTVPTAAPVAPPTVPTAAISALSQATRLNDRLLTDAGRLSAALAARGTSSSELAKILRSLSANASFGDRLQPSLVTWDAAAPLSEALAAFYASVGTTAQDGLDASLLNERAYVDASRRMVRLLDGLAALDAQARAIAAEAGVELPPLSAPAP